MQKIIETFCQARNVAQDDIATYERSQNHYFTRYMIWHYLHCCKGISARELSKTFKRNKPSIFRGIRILKHQFRYDARLREEYLSIVAKLEGIAEATPSDNMEEK